MKETLLRGHILELNVLKIFLKKYFILIALFSSAFFYGQKYFLLDSLKTNFAVKEYTLKTKELYNINKEIKIYNVFISENTILLLSVLPNFQGDSSWKEIKKNEIDTIFSKNYILNMISEIIEENKPNKKTLEFKIIKKENGSYFVSNFCLMEVFTIRNYEFPFVSNYGVINIKEKMVSIKKMQESFKKQFPKEDFIMDVRADARIRNLDNQYSFKNYLSKKYKIKNHDAYQFWTFDGWWFIDGYNDYRGIDRFVYIKNFGIVGGSYDFYFELKPRAIYDNVVSLPVNDDVLWNNIINERVMIAEELK